jgi:microcystin-dependent protein
MSFNPQEALRTSGEMGPYQEIGHRSMDRVNEAVAGIDNAVGAMDQAEVRRQAAIEDRSYPLQGNPATATAMADYQREQYVADAQQQVVNANPMRSGDVQVGQEERPVAQFAPQQVAPEGVDHALATYLGRAA